METSEERASSALIILGNPPGTFAVSNGDIPELLEFAADKNPAVRQMAVYQLQQLKTTSYFDDIIFLLLDNDISVARNAEELLLSDEERIIPLLRTSLESDSPQLRLTALDLLVKLQDRDSLPAIIARFSDPEPSVVTKAIDSASKLADISDRILFDTLLSTETALRVGVVKTFSKMGDPSILGTLLPYFYDPDVKVQNAVKFTFVSFGDASIPYLLNVLNNPVATTQIAVLGLLEALQNEESVSHIIPLFNHENEKVKTRAFNTVASFKAKALIPLSEFLGDNDVEIIISCVRLLGNINNDDVLPFLIPLLNHHNNLVRDAAFESILKFKDTAGDQFLKIIDTGKDELYRSAVSGLMLLSDLRLVSDKEISLYRKNNRGRVFILNASLEELGSYLNNINVSGLIVRDFTLLKQISLAASLLINSERAISESGSKYTTFYISKNDFNKKSEEALKLSFSYMHDYMSSRNPEDLETAKQQREFSNMFKEAAAGLDIQLNNYIGTTDEEENLIKTFEKSRADLISSYESVSLNRKNLADDVLSEYSLYYTDILSGNLSSFSQF